MLRNYIGVISLNIKILLFFFKSFNYMRVRAFFPNIYCSVRYNKIRMRNVAFSAFYCRLKCHFYGSSERKKWCVLAFIIQNLRLFRAVISAGLDGSNPAEIRHSYVQLADMTELNNQSEFRRNSSSVFGLLTG